MKNYILHGDNQSASRNKLNEIIDEAKQDSLEVFNYSWSSKLLGEILTLSQSQSLLAEEKLIVIENFFSGNKKAVETIVEIKEKSTGVLVFWEGKLITQSVINKLSKEFLIQEFKLPVTIFKFLESIAPNNSKVEVSLFRQATTGDSAEFLMYMLSRHIRLLIWAKVDPETLKVPDWQKKKLSIQSSKFSKDQLLELHSKLLELDRMSKRSRLVGSLSENLEELLVSI